MPLTLAQLQAEGLPAVVSRLVGRRHYLLAMRICQSLGLSTEQVRACQACALACPFTEPAALALCLDHAPEGRFDFGYEKTEGLPWSSDLQQGKSCPPVIRPCERLTLHPWSVGTLVVNPAPAPRPCRC